MDENETSNTIIRNIVIEVMRDCKNRKILVDQDFVSFFAELLKLDPNRGLSEDFLNIRERVQNFIKYLVNQLQRRNDPKIITLKLQHRFRVSFESIDNAVKKFRTKLQTKLYPLLVEIVEPNEKHSEDDLYHKICFYIILASGLGNPNEKLVFKEALQVLKSILESEEVAVFPSLMNFIRQEIIENLVELTMGVRLYNKYCKKGGEGIRDVPELLATAINKVKLHIEGCMRQFDNRATVLTNYMEKRMFLNQIKNTYCVDLESMNEKERKEWIYIKDLAIVYRQANKALRTLLKYSENLEKNTARLNEEIIETVENLNKVVVPNLYQAVSHVYPHFEQLCKIWKYLQDDAIRLKEVSHILNYLSKSVFSLYFDGSIGYPVDENTRWSLGGQDEPLQLIENDYIKLLPNCPEETEIEFGGYCCWALVHSDGALIPGRIAKGIIEYNNKFYSFSSYIAANFFIREPEQYIAKAIKLARSHVHLIKLLDIEDKLKDVHHVKVLVKESLVVKTYVKDECSQTDTHFNDSNIQLEYNWNVWEHKRKILKMADLQLKCSKATETVKTYDKVSEKTQTYTPKESFAQSNVDNYTNTARPVRYLYGLRGRRKDCAVSLDLSEAKSCGQSVGFNKSKSFKYY